jgi:hypothetical protein
MQAPHQEQLLLLSALSFVVLLRTEPLTYHLTSAAAAAGWIVALA